MSNVNSVIQYYSHLSELNIDDIETVLKNDDFFDIPKGFIKRIAKLIKGKNGEEKK